LPWLALEKKSSFSFSQLSTSQTTQLLGSTYDMSGCIVNCTNQGSCVFDSENNKFKCACNAYFSGLACQLDTRACSSNPCLNNATCVDVYSNSTSNSSSVVDSKFRCECQSNYEGAYCETKINICANETCSSNGNCE
jgi:hypothetical protein